MLRPGHDRPVCNITVEVHSDAGIPDEFFDFGQSGVVFIVGLVRDGHAGTPSVPVLPGLGVAEGPEDQARGCVDDCAG
jgi:hypothetical protein